MTNKDGVMKAIKISIGNCSNKRQRSARAEEQQISNYEVQLLEKREDAIPAIPTRLDSWKIQNGFHIQIISKQK